MQLYPHGLHPGPLDRCSRERIRSILVVVFDVDPAAAWGYLNLDFQETLSEDQVCLLQGRVSEQFAYCV